MLLAVGKQNNNSSITHTHAHTDRRHFQDFFSCKFITICWPNYSFVDSENLTSGPPNDFLPTYLQDFLVNDHESEENETKKNLNNSHVH